VTDFTSKKSVVFALASAVLLACAVPMVARADEHEHRGGNPNQQHGDRHGESRGVPQGDPRGPSGGRQWNGPWRGVHHESLDSRHFHNRYYPAYGHAITALPPRHEVVVHNGARFYFSSGVWYHHDGVRFVVALPPPGIAVRVLPPYYTRVWVYGVPYPYYYANNVYYVQSTQGYVVAPPPPPSDVIEQAPEAGAGDDSITEEPADQ